MDLSIVIVNYKAKGLLKNCLRSLFKQPLGIKTEVIVVDNCSGDGTEQLLKTHFPQVKLISSPSNVGYAAGNNLGIKQSQGRYILLLNPDTVTLDNSLERFVQFMDQNPDAGAAACRLVNPDGTLQMNCRKYPTLAIPIFSRTMLGRLPKAKAAMAKYLMIDLDRSQKHAVDWVLSACMIVRRKAMDQVGLLDENFFIYFADVDWCRQFRQKGWQIYFCPDAELIHYFHRESAEDIGLLSTLKRSTRIHIWDWMKYLRKYHRAKMPLPHPEILTKPINQVAN
ncbi:glycosyltransferase family 2 protein [Candidatus Uhrbacteria bacterium]|nr:glycosyltransferase family 2 protein [Candidatus Uhrbacteria bacterium]